MHAVHAHYIHKPPPSMDRQTLIHSLEWLDLIYGNWTCNGIGNIKKLIPIDFHEKILICRLNYNAHSHHQPITTYIADVAGRYPATTWHYDPIKR